jgi:adenine-specific DNA-methyltransferase
MLVQLPEETDERQFGTIAAIGRERLRRAAAAIRDGSAPEDLGHLDLGFRAFSLSDSNITDWLGTAAALEQDLLSVVDNIRPRRSSKDVLFEVLLKYGLDLSLQIEGRDISGSQVFVLGAGAMVVCLEADITLETVDGIGALKRELEPEVMRVVFRDTSFKDDVVKTNAMQILKRAGIDDVKSL